jgi:hypothetical protein
VSLENVDIANEALDVDRLLEEWVTDDRKRLAFRLHMDGFPAKSKKSNSIARVMNIDESTAREWIEEVQKLLKSKVGGTK